MLKRYIAVFLCALAPLAAKTYNVGPDQTLSTLGEVPWSQLKAGDTVNIYYQSDCYAEKILISTQGSSWDEPITIQGIRDPATGRQACLTGVNAVQAPQANDRWSGAKSGRYSESLYVVGISLHAGADAAGPAYIVLKNLDISGAAPGMPYTAGDGTSQVYGEGVSGVRLINASHVRIQNCYIHHIAGNGLFGKPNPSYPGSMADIQLLNNRFGANGKAGSFLYHNTYLESDQALYGGNLYEPLVPGALGGALKDRSAGTIIRYNFFRGSAARLIDLVEPQDGWAAFGGRSYYGEDYVYGNLFYLSSKDANYTSVGTPVHYGGDQGNAAVCRNRTLSFSYNTFVFNADLEESWKQAIFQPELATAVVDVRNNIFMFAPKTPGHAIPEIDFSGNNNGKPTGTFRFGVNWVSPGWNMSFTAAGPFGGTSTGSSNLITHGDNRSPLVDAAGGDLRLAPSSGAVGVAGDVSVQAVTGSLGSNTTPDMQYSPDQQVVVRTSLRDLGALQSVTAGRPGSPRR